VSWVPFLVRERPEIVVALDWTDHDADDHTTCMLSLVTAHGRTTPMVWKTMREVASAPGASSRSRAR
jgi:hypothetical protein